MSTTCAASLSNRCTTRMAPPRIGNTNVPKRYRSSDSPQEMPPHAISTTRSESYDFGFVGHDKHLMNMPKHMCHKFTVKVAATCQHDRNESRVSNRRITWTTHGIEYESDIRHAGRPSDDAKAATRKTVMTPAIFDSRQARKSDSQATEVDGDTPSSDVGNLVRTRRRPFAPASGNPGGHYETPQRRWRRPWRRRQDE